MGVKFSGPWHPGWTRKGATDIAIKYDDTANEVRQDFYSIDVIIPGLRQQRQETIQDESTKWANKTQTRLQSTD